MFELINRILKECKRQNTDKHIVIRLDAMYVWLLSIIFQIIYMILLVFTSNVYNKILLLLFQYSINAILSGDEENKKNNDELFLLFYHFIGENHLIVF